MLKKFFVMSVCAAALACSPATESDSSATDAAAPVEEVDQNVAPATPSLDEVLAALPADATARIPYRHPKETLEFFGIAPGMTVVDTVPGDIWYAGILAAYLGPQGKVIGADRPLSVWEWFGPEYAPPEFLAEQVNWPQTWPAEQAAKHGTDGASFGAVTFGSVPPEMAETADAVMIVREIHNIMGADESGVLVANVLGEIHMMLKPGGVFGIVQHRAPESASDAWANGENGYVKQSAIVAAAEAAGFTLEATSDVNANPNDQPTEEDAVWRLPPTLDGAEEDETLRAAMMAIGESDRMTLKFRKAE